MTLWDLTTDEFAFQFLIYSSGSCIYRAMRKHPYMYLLKDITIDDIEEFYNEYIRSEIRLLIDYRVHENQKVEPKHNPDMWVTAIAVLIHERIDDPRAEEILKELNYPEPTIFHICSRHVFQICWKRYQIRKEWVKQNYA